MVKGARNHRATLYARAQLRGATLFLGGAGRRLLALPGRAIRALGRSVLWLRRASLCHRSHGARRTARGAALLGPLPRALGQPSLRLSELPRSGAGLEPL